VFVYFGSQSSSEYANPESLSALDFLKMLKLLKVYPNLVAFSTVKEKVQKQAASFPLFDFRTFN